MESNPFRVRAELHVFQLHYPRRYHKTELEELCAVSSIMRQAEEAEERFARWNDGQSQRVKVEQNQVGNCLFPKVSFRPIRIEIETDKQLSIEVTISFPKWSK